MYVCVYTYMYVSLYIHKHVYARLHARTYSMYVHSHRHTCMLPGGLPPQLPPAYVHTDTPANIDVYMHTHAHTCLRDIHLVLRKRSTCAFGYSCFCCWSSVLQVAVCTKSPGFGPVLEVRSLLRLCHFVELDPHRRAGQRCRPASTQGRVLLQKENASALGRMKPQPTFDPHDEDSDKAYFWIEQVYAGIFLIEILLRITAEGRRFFCSSPDIGWNYLDVLIICTSVLTLVTELAEQSVDGSDGSLSGNVRIIRILRVTRVMRVVRIVKIVRFIRALRSLVHSIFSTMKASCNSNVASCTWDDFFT